jgi:hypothetical protein
MDERELETILHALARERRAPSERLLRRTKSVIRGRRLFHLMAFLSLGMQAIGVVAGIFVLMSPEVRPAVKIFTLAGLTAFFGAIAVVVVAARRQVVLFFRRVERLTG